MVEVELGSLMDNALKLTDYKVRKSDISIEKKYDPAGLLYVSANQLEQVLINLILNGIDAIDLRKHREAGHKGKIELRAAFQNGRVKIMVQDNGTGISEEHKRKVFDPFFTSKDHGKGTGLGLYVSYNIIKDLGGELSFSSKENQGTIFFIELPNNKK
jgi:C4-dicarboxylate-specific signal transduction histidine kinase